MSTHFVPWTNRKNAAGWVEGESGCHIWVGSRNADGYGNAWYGGRCLKAHRVRYELEVGPIPEGMELDHYVCSRGHEGCCNPLHCRPVTHRENVLRSDSASARNRVKTHCPVGHALTDENVIGYDLRVTGRRVCRICSQARQNARRRRQRSKGNEVEAT